MSLLLVFTAACGESAAIPDAPDAQTCAPPSICAAEDGESAPDTSVDAAADARAPDAADGDAGAGGACHDLVNVGTNVVFTAEASPPPTPLGGTIVDGTYVLTTATLYTGTGGASGPTGDTRSMTMRITGARGDSIFDGVARTAQFAVSGTTMTSTSVCPESGGTRTDGYDATPTTFAVHLGGSQGVLVQSFTRVGQ